MLVDEIEQEGGHPVLSTPAINDRIRRRVADLRGHRALDVGCGPTPVAANALAEAGFSAVGVDVATSILGIARRTAAPGVTLAAADGERLPFPDAAFEAVTCDDTIEHVFDQAALLDEIARVLRPGGRLLLVTPNASGLHVLRARLGDLVRGLRRPREAYHITASHVRELRWQEIDRLCRARFRRRHVERVPYDRPGIWRLADALIRLPGLWRFAPVHFLELERRAEPAPGSLADHYRLRTDHESQTSPPTVQAALEDTLAELGAEWGNDAVMVDVGTGGGANLGVARRHGRFAVGAEISERAARRAAAVGPVVVADACRLPFRTGAASTAVCTEVLEHVEDPGAVLGEMARVLRPGGLAYVTTPNYANLAGVHKWAADLRSGRHDWNPWGAHAGGHERFVTGRRLARAAAPHFRVLRARGLDHGQAITGRFGVLDRAAWSRPGRAVLGRLLPRLERSRSWPAVWHGMHIELLLERRAP